MPDWVTSSSGKNPILFMNYKIKRCITGLYLNYQDRLAIANKGAEWFLELLAK